MSHAKIEPNIYYDRRCTNMPYFVNIMRNGQKLYKKFRHLEEAKDAKEKFIEKTRVQETEHPIIFIKNGKYVIETAFHKEFDDWDEAVRKADIILKFMDN